MANAMEVSNDRDLLAAAMSAMMGIQIYGHTDSQTSVKKISWFDYHAKTYSYGPLATLVSRTPGSTISAGSCAQQKTDDRISILIMSSTCDTFTCQINPNDTVNDLRKLIEQLKGFPHDQQQLIFSGKILQARRRLSDYGIHEGYTLHMMYPVHDGSSTIVLDSKSLDPRYDYDFTHVNDKNQEFTRGGRTYVRPCGWKRYAINVTDKFDNMAWLGQTNSRDEWPVSYHGTGLFAAKHIAEAGYDLAEGKRFRFERGIYSTPDIKVAETYATKFPYNKQNYKVILQNRVNPKTLIEIPASRTGSGVYWISENDKHIRPYGICIRKA